MIWFLPTLGRGGHNVACWTSTQATQADVWIEHTLHFTMQDPCLASEEGSRHSEFQFTDVPQGPSRLHPLFRRAHVSKQDSRA